MNHTEEKLSQLEEKLNQIQARNQKVELDKAWETSNFRIFTLTFFTYFVTSIVFFLIDVRAPLLNALIPTIGFYLSTQSLPLVKSWWIEKKKAQNN